MNKIDQKLLKYVTNQIEKLTGLKLKSVSSRLSELVKLKYINKNSTTNSVQYSITTQGIYWLSSVLSKKIF